MAGRLAGKLALVTGAAQGLGAAIAEHLAREGARVLLTDIQDQALEATAAQINHAYPGHALTAHHDVTSEDDWDAALKTADTQLGGLHILVNNAGIIIIGSVEDLSLKAWRKVQSVDLDSVFLGCKAALPLMRKSGGGAIVNISSVSGLIAGHNLAAYNAAKAGVRHLTKSVALHGAKTAREGGPLVRCNSVHPVFVDTPMIDAVTPDGDREAAIVKFARQVPIGRIAVPEDVSSAVVFLASDESTMITGAELAIDGGVSAM